MYTLAGLFSGKVTVICTESRPTVYIVYLSHNRDRSSMYYGVLGTKLISMAIARGAN